MHSNHTVVKGDEIQCTQCDESTYNNVSYKF